jgi:hypothetical protein
MYFAEFVQKNNDGEYVRADYIVPYDIDGIWHDNKRNTVDLVNKYRLWGAMPNFDHKTTYLMLLCGDTGQVTIITFNERFDYSHWQGIQ